MICRECGEYMELVDEGLDDSGARYDMYVCIECGHNEAVPQPDSDSATASPRYEWDPPDGSPSRNW